MVALFSYIATFLDIELDVLHVFSTLSILIGSVRDLEIGYVALFAETSPNTIFLWLEYLIAEKWR